MEREKTALLLPGTAGVLPTKARALLEVPAIKYQTGEIGAITGLDIEQGTTGGDLSDFLVAQQLQLITSVELGKKVMRALRPDFLVGDSLGEYSALCLAGAFDLTVAAVLIQERAKLLTLVRNGAMAKVEAAPEFVREVIRPYLRLEIAAISGPAEVTITGYSDQVEKAVKEFVEERKVAARVFKRPKVASHSTLLKGTRLDDFHKYLGTFEFHPLSYPVVATNRAAVLPADDPREVKRYLKEQMITPVRLYDTVRFLWNEGVRRFVEVGATLFAGKKVSAIFPEAEVFAIDSQKSLDEFKQLVG